MDHNFLTRRLTANVSAAIKIGTMKNFKHSVTGLQLDEIHSDFSCEDCHIDNDYSVKPGCDNCHDDYAFPNQKPGNN